MTVDRHKARHARTRWLTGKRPAAVHGMSAFERQVGGSHYTWCAIQPAEYSERNKLSHLESSVVKRVTRHRQPTAKGAEDIHKAIHELELLLEIHYPDDDE